MSVVGSHVLSVDYSHLRSTDPSFHDLISSYQVENQHGRIRILNSF